MTSSALCNFSRITQDTYFGMTTATTNNTFLNENQIYVYTFTFSAYTAQMVDGYSISVATKCYPCFMLTVSEIYNTSAVSQYSFFS